MEDKLRQIQKLLDIAEGDLHSARNLLRNILKNENIAALDIDDKLKDLNTTNPEEKIIEGIFNGECMVGKDGKTYLVSPNYASKSKLIEGDTLKLTIADNGNYIFKQISPAERRKIVGSLVLNGTNTYNVFSEGKNYKVLTASVTYYKGNPGDQATIILPKNHDSVWAALDGIVKKSVDNNKLITGQQTSVTETESVNETTQNNESPLPTTEIENHSNDYILTEEKTIPVPAETKPEEEQIAEPEIEFPGNNLSVSNEEVLKDVTSDIKNESSPVQEATEETNSNETNETEEPPTLEDGDQKGLLDEFIKPIDNSQPIYPTSDTESSSIKELEI